MVVVAFFFATFVESGNKLYVKEGIYNEIVSTKRAGTADKKISYIAHPKRKAKVYGFVINNNHIHINHKINIL